MHIAVSAVRTWACSCSPVEQSPFLVFYLLFQFRPGKGQ
jgi:hypothetical protein